MTKTSEVLVAAALCLALAAPASAAVPPALGPDGVVFPFAGGGRSAPREGLPATRARFEPTATAVLPDGRVAFLHEGGPPFLVGLDGRIALLPAVDGAHDVAATPDGAIIVVTSGPSARVLRLMPGAGAWSLDRTLPGGFDAHSIAALPAGYVVTGGRRALRFEHGSSTAVSLPRYSVLVEPLPDGSLAVASAVGDRIEIVSADGARRLLRDRAGPNSQGLAVMDDGTLVRQRGADVEAISSVDGRIETTVRPPVGCSGLQDATPDGALLFARRLCDVELVVPPGTARPLATITADSFRLLPSRRVAFTTTFAGLARVEIRLAGIVQTAAAANVAAGPGVLDLPVGLPAARFSVRLQVTAADGREAVMRQHIDTRASLGLRRARRIAGRLLPGLRVGPCRRLGARSVRCATRRGPRCEGTVVVEQRGEGPLMRFRGGVRACRVLVREHHS